MYFHTRSLGGMHWADHYYTDYQGMVGSSVIPKKSVLKLQKGPSKDLHPALISPMERKARADNKCQQNSDQT